MTERPPSPLMIAISIVCSPEQLADVQARLSALQADLERLGVAFSVRTHHDPPARPRMTTLEEPQRDPQAFLAGFVENEHSVNFDPELDAAAAGTAWRGSMAEQTRVVNVKAGAPCTVYIGRANGRYRLRQSKWHNPSRIGPDGTREEVLDKYRADLLGQPELLAQIGELRARPWAAGARR